VLIANEYHDVFHDRETNIRRLPRNRALKWYLAELEQKERPVAVERVSVGEVSNLPAW
jgi:hypothetical protein